MGKQRSSFFNRVLAAGLDGIFSTILGVSISFIVFYQPLTDGSLLQEITAQGHESQTMKQLISVILVINLIYYLSEIFWGVSLGKIILGLRIQGITGDSTSALLLRYFVKHMVAVLHLLSTFITSNILESIGTTVLFILLFGFLLSLRKSRLALHDTMTATQVCDQSE